MKPSPEFLRQHKVEPPQVDRAHFRQAWRVRPQLETLLQRGAIGPDEFRAGDNFRNLWSRAFGSLTASSMPRLAEFVRTRGRQNGQFTPHLNAVANLCVIQHDLGEPTFRLLVACLVDDLTWIELGRRWKLHRNTAKSRVVDALQKLASRYRHAS